MNFSSDSFMIEKPYNVMLIPPVSAGGLGKQLVNKSNERTANAAAGKCVRLMARVLKQRNLPSRGTIVSPNNILVCGGEASIPQVRYFGEAHSNCGRRGVFFLAKNQMTFSMQAGETYASIRIFRKHGGLCRSPVR